MGDFHRVDSDVASAWAFVRGPARLLAAPEAAPFPTQLSNIVVMASGVTQYDASGTWTDLGATKGGVQISVNHTEEVFDVDQILGDIQSAPTGWEANVSTALAENTLEHLQIAWEGSAITTNATPNPDERTMSYGNPVNYIRRRLAVLYRSADGLVRAYVFRRVQLAPVESAVTFNKTGEQASIPVQWKALADTSVTDPAARFFSIIEQVES